MPVACYPIVVHNIQHVGKCSAQLVKRIRDFESAEIHVVGFSLGAQVANFIANNLEPFKLDRITAIDPAFPGFIMTDKRKKLDPSDAHFVDVLHCNVRNFHVNFEFMRNENYFQALIQGQLETCGTVDVYMNGGFVQPGCEGEFA